MLSEEISSNGYALGKFTVSAAAPVPLETVISGSREILLTLGVRSGSRPPADGAWPPSLTILAIGLPGEAAAALS